MNSTDFYHVSYPGLIHTQYPDHILWRGHDGKIKRITDWDQHEQKMFFEKGVWVKANNEETVCYSANAVQPQVGAIPSDGGSSSYYDISLPLWLVAKIGERAANGHAFIKTEELIITAFNNDFDAGNTFKSLVRLWGSFNGAGKAGNSVSYEKKKIEYSVDKLEQRFKRKEESV